jgi:membrane dipeptidase
MKRSLTKNTLGPLVLTALAVFLFSCQEKQPADNTTDAALKKTADELAHRYVIIDGHVDLPSALYEKKFQPGRDNDTLIHTKKGDFDYERAVRGGLYAPFMSIYVPATYQKRKDYGKSFADTLIDMVRGIAGSLPEKFALANSPGDVKANFAAGKISLPMGMENGAPIGKDLKNVKYFYDRGIRYITLTHTKDNQICDSSGDTTHTSNGLSRFGRDVVKEMNRVGIMVDISHVDDSTFYQVMKLTNVPCIASHSSCRYFSPLARRDMTDDMIRKMGENKGVILVNFYTAFLDSATNNRLRKDDKKLQALLAEKKLKSTDSLAKPIVAQFNKENPLPPVDIEVVADHIDHIVKLIGIDDVGFGSDFDGVGGLLPVGLTDVSLYPNLIYVLLKRGYSEKDIEKINGGNFRRVWQHVLDAANH